MLIAPLKCDYSASTMDSEMLDVAEFAAYIMAVLVGLDMIAERWLPCCRTKTNEHVLHSPDGGIGRARRRTSDSLELCDVFVEN